MVVKDPNQNLKYAVSTSCKLVEIESGKVKNEVIADQPLSQLVMMRNGRTLIVGTGGEALKEVNSDHFLGSIQVYKFPFEKTSEVSAHGEPMIRMRLSFCNNYLFSSGMDGHIYLFDVKDKGPGGLRKDKEIIGLDYSDEILT